ncbi:MAG: AAA family ATPase [Thauera sp.]|nr:AAA family ATPase [Thauera sp.]
MSAPAFAVVKDPAPPVRRYQLLTSSDLADRPRLRWRVKNVLPQTGLAALIGPSGSGKTFLALDLVAAVAHGEPWFGNRVHEAPVAYVALEGEAGIANRIAAHEIRTRRKLPDHFRVIVERFELLSIADVPALAETLKAAGIVDGITVIDTLNRAAGGADENSSADMGLLIAALTELQSRVGGLILIVHHTGKDAARGARGHSSLFAALDACIEVTRTDARREWKQAKAKDGEDGKSHPFRLDVVEIGEDEDGDPITSCVVAPEERAADAVRRVKLPTGGNQKIIYDALRELLREARRFGMAGAPPTRPCIEIQEAIEKTRDRLAVESDRKTERTRQAITGLVNSGALVLREGWLWLA